MWFVSLLRSKAVLSEAIEGMEIKKSDFNPVFFPASGYKSPQLWKLFA
jgi:hypothetical protein